MSTPDPTPADDAAFIDGHWDFNDPATSERGFRELAAQLTTQVARTLSLQRRFDEAHALLDEIEAAPDEHGPLVRVRCLLERGRTLNSSGRRDESKPIFLEAWKRAAEIGADFYTVDAAHMLGIVEPPESAMIWNERGSASPGSDPRATRARSS